MNAPMAFRTERDPDRQPIAPSDALSLLAMAKLGRSSAENGSPRLQEPIMRFS